MRGIRTAIFLSIIACALSASAQPDVQADGPPEAPDELRPFVGGEVDQDTILERIATGYPREMRQVGTSSVTLRMELGRVRVAYKPRTDAHPRGYLAEIAAYRLSRLLHMDNVPPVLGLNIPRPVIQRHFTSDHAEDWEPIREQIRWDGAGVCRGAAIYWIPAMRSSELATEDGVDAVASWLTLDGEIPEGSAGPARDLSTIFAFDYLIGNWDRLSGGNVSRTDQGDRLFIRDHNVAFNAPFTDGRYDRVRANLERVQRFSRSFIEHVAAIDEAAIGAALEADPQSEVRAILSEDQIAGVIERRRALLSYVAALVAVHGADRVLPWR